MKKAKTLGMKHCPKCFIVSRPLDVPDAYCHLDGTALIPTEPALCRCGQPTNRAYRHCAFCGTEWPWAT